MRLLAYLLIVCMTFACVSKQKDGARSEHSLTDNDSLLTSDSVATISHLPDTAYPSASMIRYGIELKDSSIDSTINSLDNLYERVTGSLAFRHGPTRQANFGGKVKGTPDTIIVDWCFTTDYDTCKTKYGIWGGGTGWTGQPLYVKWDAKEVERIRKQENSTTDFDNEEIIVGSLCGNVYFLNFNNGKPSREPIATGNPIKGTPSLDPCLNGRLYVGQGVPAKRPFGHMAIDIDKGKIIQFMPEDRKAFRGWGAFDSSPIRVGQFLFWPSENGSLYKYLCTDDSLKLHSVMRYKKGWAAPGMEASMCVYRNYGYTADNHGNVVCINLNTLRPVWCFENGDDTDATTVADEEDGTPYIYTACEIERNSDSLACFRKLNALNGELIWENKLPGRRFEKEEKLFDGGYYATPLLGQGNCKGLIFANCVMNTKRQNGDFIAFDRKTGDIVYRTPLKHYAWSSPVGFTNENGDMFVFTADTFGNVYLINGIDGKILFTCRVGENFESSPVVINNHVVVGSRGRSIFKMTIK